jgi:uncharacterized protein
MTMHPPSKIAQNRLARGLYFSLGLLAAGLAVLGSFLPVLPTTPFLILATACFVRSSSRFHQLLLTNRIFGPYLVQWEHDHTVPREAKRKAYTLVVLSFGLSIYLVGAPWLRFTLAGIGVVLLVLLYRLPTTPSGEPVD